MPIDKRLEEEHRNEDLRAEDDLLYLETTAKPAAATAATEADVSKEFEVLSSNLLARAVSSFLGAYAKKCLEALEIILAF